MVVVSDSRSLPCAVRAYIHSFPLSTLTSNLCTHEQLITFFHISRSAV